MHRTRRAPGRRTLASIAIGALLAGAAAVGVTAPAAAADAPTVTISEAPRAGGAATVSGAGFDVDTTGIYVGIGPAGLGSFYEGSAQISSVTHVSSLYSASTASTAPLATNGSFSIQIPVPAFSAEVPLAVYTSKAHGLGAGRDRSQNTTTAITYAAVPTPTVSLSKSSGLDAAGETITVTGSGFVENAPATNGTRQPLPGSFGGAYVAFGYLVGDSFTRISTQYAVPNTASVSGSIALAGDGSFTALLQAADDQTAPAGARFGVRTWAGSGSSYAPFTTFTDVSFAEPQPEPQPEPEPEPQPEPAAKVSVGPSTVLDPNVRNTLTISGTGFTGPGAANGAYVAFGTKAQWAPGSKPGQGAWIAQAHVPKDAIVAGAFTTTLTVPVGTLVPGTEYQVATFAAHSLSQSDRTLDTSTTITVQDVTVRPAINLSIDTVLQGGELTVRGAGLQAGKTAVVTVNSDPYELGRATVGGDGRFSVTGTLPASFATGSHTVTVEVDGVELASAPLTVAAAILPAAVEAPPAETCTARAVRGASISWDVKESFRSYIQSTTANGSYSINWGGGNGAFNTEDDRGRVAYSGSASFSGHSGALDMNLSNPRIQVTSATSASLVLDVRSAGYGSNAGVSATGVAFATLRLPAATETADRISWNGASATLTAAGAKAFSGFYSAGESLDPVSFSFPLGAEVECDATTSTTLASTGSERGAQTLWIGLGLLLIGAGVFALRRRTAGV